MDELLEDLLDEIATTEHHVESELDFDREKVRSADHALTMLRNAAHVGTVAKIKDTVQTIRLLAPTEVLEAIRTPMEVAQSFVYVRRGEKVLINRK